MSKRANLLGQRFGRLLVKETVELGRRTHWGCVCDCGKTTVAHTTDLRAGKVKSCGCWKADIHRKPPGEAGFNTLYRRYQNDAVRRNHVFELSRAEFRALTSASCHYCNTAPGRISTHNPKNASPEALKHAAYVYNGVDRIDNNVGYISSNCVSCCDLCNALKQDLPLETFLNQIQQILTHLNKTTKE